jgi:hypothetical protein
VPQFDAVPEARIGWFEGRAENVATVRADDRFALDPGTSAPGPRPRRRGPPARRRAG